MIRVKNARKKICCGPAHMSQIQHDCSPTCAGPECMAWRWAERPNYAEMVFDRKGYCGLAGAPTEWEVE